MANTTSLFVLFGQRKDSYPGEYAPEALEVMDEFSYNENSGWLHTRCDERRKSGEFDRCEIIKVGVDYNQIIKIMNPEPEVPGKVEGKVSEET